MSTLFGQQVEKLPYFFMKELFTSFNRNIKYMIKCIVFFNDISVMCCRNPFLTHCNSTNVATTEPNETAGPN